MKLLRTIRLDPSDTFVFEKAAEPGEWAVPGSFVFWQQDISALEGRARSAFRAGFLGVASLGWSTLAQIVETDEGGRDAAVETLARHLVQSFAAPDMETARRAAGEEVAYAASLCEHPADTLVALHRVFEDGAIRETFRTLRPRNGPKPLRVFSFLEADEEEAPDERIDLAGLAQGAHKGTVE
ncbi:MAG TPA: DUF6505 family protein [Xanthobacteraceae bacterium]|nr:DUF6505 family protein [Xanthobacteraceae bacterium]